MACVSGDSELDVIAVEIEVLLVGPPVDEIAVWIGLGNNQEVQLFQERLQAHP